MAVLLSLVAGAQLVAAQQRQRPKALPADASAVIGAVATAARHGDLKGVRAAMVDDFTWSFGGDRNADQAIEAWGKDPRSLRGLARVLDSGCRATDADHIECPGRGGTGFRAGFAKSDGRWRMEFFVEGD